MPNPVRRRLAAASLVLLVPALSACGFNYQTDQVYQPSVGVNNRDGAVDVLGAVVVSGIDGQGTVVASLVNKDATRTATLQSINATSSSSGLTVKLAAPVEVKPESLVNLADSGAGSITGDSVKPGAFARITFSFDGGQNTTVNVPVVDQTDQWATIKPANPSSSSSPSSSPSASSTATP